MKLMCVYKLLLLLTNQDQVILELENRTVLLRKEMDNNIQIITKLETENSSLKRTCEQMAKEHDETKAQ